MNGDKFYFATFLIVAIFAIAVIGIQASVTKKIIESSGLAAIGQQLESVEKECPQPEQVIKGCYSREGFSWDRTLCRCIRKEAHEVGTFMHRCIVECRMGERDKSLMGMDIGIPANCCGLSCVYSLHNCERQMRETERSAGEGMCSAIGAALSRCIQGETGAPGKGNCVCAGGYNAPANQQACEEACSQNKREEMCKSCGCWWNSKERNCETSVQEKAGGECTTFCNQFKEESRCNQYSWPCRWELSKREEERK